MASIWRRRRLRGVHLGPERRRRPCRLSCFQCRPSRIRIGAAQGVVFRFLSRRRDPRRSQRERESARRRIWTLAFAVASVVVVRRSVGASRQRGREHGCIAVRRGRHRHVTGAGSASRPRCPMRRQSLRFRSRRRSRDGRRLDPLGQAVVAFAVFSASSVHPRRTRPGRFGIGRHCRVGGRRDQAGERTVEADGRKRRCGRGGGGARSADRFVRNADESQSGRVLNRTETCQRSIHLRGCNVVETLAPSPKEGRPLAAATTSGRRLDSTRRERRRRRAVTRRDRLPPLLVVQ